MNKALHHIAHGGSLLRFDPEVVQYFVVCVAAPDVTVLALFFVVHVAYASEKSYAVGQRWGGTLVEPVLEVCGMLASIVAQRT